MDHEEDPNTRSLIRTKIENIRQSLGADYEAIADRMLQIRELNIEPDKNALKNLENKQPASSKLNPNFLPHKTFGSSDFGSSL